MGMMLPCITTNYHAYNSLVYPILFQFPFIKHSTHCTYSQEDNDQAFPITR
jgi:hypothetical protein